MGTLPVGLWACLQEGAGPQQARHRHVISFCCDTRLFPPKTRSRAPGSAGHAVRDWKAGRAIGPSVAWEALTACGTQPGVSGVVRPQSGLIFIIITIMETVRFGIIAILCATSCPSLFAALPEPPRSVYGSCSLHVDFPPLVPTASIPCYDEALNPRCCAPGWKNVASGRTVIASSTCGTPREWFCGREKTLEPLNPSDHESMIDDDDSDDDKIVCEWCDAEDPKKSHPAVHLNDPSNVTRWQSSKDHKVVWLILSLGKSFEITSVSLHFFPPTPEATAIYRSSDFGKTWRPLRFYSTDCLGFYGRSSKTVVSGTNEQEVLCSNPGPRLFRGGTIKFNTLEGRPSGHNFEASPSLQDWVTATDVCVVFQRGHPGRTSPAKHKHSTFFSVADFQVEGRCKCNGHASICVTRTDGRLECECEHNTAGADCERCRDLYHDRAWQRATPHHSHECIKCNCNAHARRCEFNPSFFHLSGQRSGGWCIGCRHNTFGSRCHLCVEGFYRDVHLEISHRKACKPCACNPIGSISLNCNRQTGRCLCKNEFEGLECDRPAKGYQHHYRPATTPYTHNCSAYCTPQNTFMTMGLEEFCKRDIAVKLKVLDEDSNADWTRYDVLLLDVLAHHGRSLRCGLHSSIFFLNRQLVCSCPVPLRRGNRYLVLGSEARPNNSASNSIELGIDTVVLPWDVKWQRRLERFKYIRQSGGCAKKE